MKTLINLLYLRLLNNPLVIKTAISFLLIWSYVYFSMNQVHADELFDYFNKLEPNRELEPIRELELKEKIFLVGFAIFTLTYFILYYEGVLDE